MKFSKQTLAGMLLIAAMFACNLPGTAPQAIAPDIQTAAALTLQAILTPSLTATVEQQSVQTSVVLNKTATATGAPTGTITPTYSVPMLTVLEQTNCRTGPGQSYEVIFTYLKGKQLEIVGRYPPEDYWLVKSAESATGTCWLWGEYVEVTGSYWVVASVTPPPTATPSLPIAPAIKWEFNCDYAAGQMEVAFTWTDNATNETGYRVLRNDQPIVELPANTTNYKDMYAFDAGEKVNYQIEVYNITGPVRSAVISVTC